eukprot:6192373-Pleurochrysis_carterae.AAC.1
MGSHAPNSAGDLRKLAVDAIQVHQPRRRLYEHYARVWWHKRLCAHRKIFRTCRALVENLNVCYSPEVMVDKMPVEEICEVASP